MYLQLPQVGQPGGRCIGPLIRTAATGAPPAVSSVCAGNAHVPSAGAVKGWFGNEECCVDFAQVVSPQAGDVEVNQLSCLRSR